MSGEAREISPEAKPDFQALVDAVLPFAQEQLSKHGGFHPFGAALSVAGEIGLRAAATDEERPAPEALLELLAAGFRKEAAGGALRACAACESVHITLPDGTSTDAIKIATEHQLGGAVTFYMPYRKRFLRGYEYGEIFARPGMAACFPG